ncbi:hypothetical protein B0T17DRAFT_164542 [Bombardia bombarda]|uniref:Transcription factor domain-containing protein n=1 Tax=Bombardia bombarda TaxID=252184 RepID=A0AA40C7R5_9PEZI|nr:hypothetical protein B0T17DRAFT_164542 [Bombardia bombarda]
MTRSPALAASKRACHARPRPRSHVCKYGTVSDSDVHFLHLPSASELTMVPDMTATPTYGAAPGGYGINSYHNMPVVGVQDMFASELVLEGFIYDYLAHTFPMHGFFPDMDFTSWNLNFDTFAIPQLESNDPSPHQSKGNLSSETGSRAHAESARHHAAFKRSPWLWDIEPIENVRRDTESLHSHEHVLPHSSTFNQLPERWLKRLKMSAVTRDRLYSMVLAENKDPSRALSFPSLDLFNYLLQAHLVHDRHQCDSWIHSPSLNPEETLPELLASVTANGASFIAVPSVWQFGLAMQEVVRQRLATIFEASNFNTRRLDCLQAYMLQLDIGLWSGFKRKTELAESFLQPLVSVSLTSLSALVLLDGEENRETRAFLQLNRGIPGLQHNTADRGDNARTDAGVGPLSNPGMVLTIAQGLFRENFPVRGKPLPPLVESLIGSLQDLGSGLVLRPPRDESEDGQRVYVQGLYLGFGWTAFYI